jgi:hypothetical protein
MIILICISVKADYWYICVTGFIFPYELFVHVLFPNYLIIYLMSLSVTIFICWNINYFSISFQYVLSLTRSERKVTIFDRELPPRKWLQSKKQYLASCQASPSPQLHWGCAPHHSKSGVPYPNQICVLQPRKPDWGPGKELYYNCHCLITESEVRAEACRLLPQ